MSMIIAIVNQHNTQDRNIVARNLAVLRARSGRKVCLAMPEHARDDSDWCADRGAAAILPRIEARHLNNRTAGSRLAQLRLLFNDMLIDAGTRDTEASRCALAAARLVLIPVRGAEIDLASQYALMTRLNAARALNRNLPVMFLMVSGACGPGNHEREAVLAHMSRVAGATLATTVLREPGVRGFGAGRCASDGLTPSADMAELYRDVYGP
ncbi:hypothetical protein [Pseudoduganella sp. RAF53_2]|uniref:hypothetical protein n=1 Tax=unclassified Pseudoduganella TaxID=2637179 RepID=UPI003F99DA53